MNYPQQKKLSSEDLRKWVVHLMDRTDLSGEGVQNIGEALGFNQEYFDAMFAIAIKYYDNNRLDDAMHILNELIALEPNNVRNYKAMGACVQAKEDYKSAINIYGHALALAAMDAEIHFYAGQCLFLDKQFAQAKNTFELANRICEKYPHKWGHIAHHVKDLLKRSEERMKQ